MSRLGRQPLPFPASVTVQVEGRQVLVAGPQGQLSLTLPAGVELTIDNQQVRVVPASGLVRSLIANMVHGVTVGWTKTVEISGTGYRATTSGHELNLTLGFSHPVAIEAPRGITFTVTENKISVEGADKALVGEIAARIRHLRPADVYKAKGLKYAGEVIRRKPGKAAKVGVTATGK